MNPALATPPGWWSPTSWAKRHSQASFLHILRLASLAKMMALLPGVDLVPSEHVPQPAVCRASSLQVQDLVTVRRAHSFGSDEKFYAKLAELRQRIRANSMPVLNKELDPHEESASRPARKSMSEVPMVCKTNLLTHSASLPRPARAARLPSLVESQQLQLELRELERSPMVGSSPRDQQVHNQHNHQTELSTLITLSDQEKLAMSQDQERPPLPPKPSTPSFSNFIIAPQPFRRSDGDPESPSLAQQAIQSWRRISEDISKQSPDLRPRSQENLAVGRTLPAAPTPAAQVRRSFVPPVRDEEHEIQRKAHAKRVRETRRSTQGVTLEDLKSAEQLVKKKQQAENAARTTELQQLVINSPGGGASPAPASPALPGSTATGTTVTTTATLVAGGGDADRHERRPSWRLRMESNDKNRFTLEDARERLNSLNQAHAAQSP